MKARRQAPRVGDADRRELAVADMWVCRGRAFVPMHLLVEVCFEIGEVVGKDATLGVVVVPGGGPGGKQGLLAMSTRSGPTRVGEDPKSPASARPSRRGGPSSSATSTPTVPPTAAPRP